MNMYEIAIIGGGPAGVSAAVNAKILNKNFIWFSDGGVSEKVGKAELINNYIGLPQIEGTALKNAFKAHAESMGIAPRGEVVTGVYEADGYFSLLAENNVYEAKTVILCLGVSSSKPIDGEEQFVGRGISYCATCDGFLYKDKTIAVMCTDKKFEHEIEFLCNLSKKAYVMPLYKGYDIKSPKAEIVLKTPVKFQGGIKLNEVVFKDRSLEVDGVFLLKGAVAPATLVKGLKVSGGAIEVGRDMSTNIKGIFAAGDCTGRPFQYAKAVGEGNVALHSAVEFLSASSH